MPRRDSHQGQQRCHKLSVSPQCGLMSIGVMLHHLPFHLHVSILNRSVPLKYFQTTWAKMYRRHRLRLLISNNRGANYNTRWLPYKKIIACLSSYQKRVANAKPFLWFSNANIILCTDSLNFTWAAEGMQRRPTLKVPLAEENRSIPPPSPSTHWT